MTGFLSTQIDFFLFVKSISYALLAMACLVLRRAGNRRLPWGMLGLFGLLHAVKDWVDLIAVVSVSHLPYPAVDALLMTAYILCLVEFGRIGIRHTLGRGPGLWIYGLLMLPVVVASFHGMAAVETALRFVLTPAGNAGAACAMLLAARDGGRTGRRPLLGAAAALAVYALFSGFMAPELPFFPASAVNEGTFARLFGFPTPIVRCTLRTWLAISVWIFALETLRAAGILHGGRKGRRHSIPFAAATALILGSGWMLTQYMGDRESREIDRMIVVHTDALASAATTVFREADADAAAVAGSRTVRNFLSGGSRSPEAVDELLGRVGTHQGTLGCFLLDRSGRPVASSARRKMAAAIHKSIRTAPLFSQPMRGKPGRSLGTPLPAIGEGYYASAPVRDGRGRIVGAAVVVRSVPMATFCMSGSRCYVVDDLGNTVAVCETARQARVPPPVKMVDGTALIDGRPFRVLRRTIGGDGWAVVSTYPMARIGAERLLGIVTTLGMFILAFVVYLTTQHLTASAVKISASEKRFQAMFDNAPEAAFILDKDTLQILEANPFMTQLLGYTRGEITSLFLEDLTMPGTADFWEDIGWILKDKKVHLKEHRYRKRDGTVIDVEVTGARVDYLEKECILILARDITQRKQMEEHNRRSEEALRRSEARYRAVVEDQTELICRWLPDGTLTFINEAYARYFGKSREVLTGTNFLTLIPEEDREAVREKVRSLGASLSPESPTTAYEHTVLSSSGEVRWQHWTDRAVFDGEGRLVEFQSVGNDITDRKETEEALRESEERFRTLVEHSLVGFFIVQEGRIVFMNPEQERIFGVRGETPAVRELATVHPEDRERFKRLCIEDRSAPGERREIDLRFQVPAAPGEPPALRWTHCRATPVRYRGKEALLVNMVDVTRAKEMEEVALRQEKMASLGHVAAGIAHEIRNPLSGLNIHLSAAEGLVEEAEGLDPEDRKTARNALGTARSASDKIEAVIRRVMDFARPKQPSLCPVNINESIREAVQLSSVTLRRNGIRMDMMLLDDPPPCRADPQLIEQVILNLITNAAQALEKKSGDRLIEIRSAIEDRHVVVRVADSGPGVPEAIRAKIFDPFYTTKNTGAGIGLSFSQRVIVDHGGFIEVGPSRLGGAEFRIGLPAAATEAEKAGGHRPSVF